MRTSKIKSLIKLVEESEINELEISFWGKKIKIRKNGQLSHDNTTKSPQVEAVIPDRVTDHQTETKAKSIPPKRDNLLEIKTPMVGTLYQAPAPDAKPYVQIGDRISRGQIVCIIEAMKIMNEIESEYDGVVVEILVQNAQPVQFGQPLFVIEPAG